MTETLTNDLSSARDEILRLRRNAENRNYIGGINGNATNNGVVLGNDDDDAANKHRNHHQKARCAGLWMVLS